MLACGLLGSGLADARVAKKQGSSASKKPSVSKKTSGKKSSAKSQGSQRRTTRARRTGPPRQTAPTPQRYMEIQQALATKGYYTGPVDGTWDASCTDALKRFQADQKLSPDGKIGALSLIALGLGPKREPLAQQFTPQPLQ